MSGVGRYVVEKFGIANEKALADFIEYAVDRCGARVLCYDNDGADFAFCVFSCEMSDELYEAIMKNTVKGPELPNGVKYRLAFAKKGGVTVIVAINGEWAYFHIINSPAPFEGDLEVEVDEELDWVDAGEFE